MGRRRCAAKRSFSVALRKYGCWLPRVDDPPHNTVESRARARSAMTGSASLGHSARGQLSRYVGRDGRYLERGRTHLDEA
jgi:hypothetical protein